MTLRAQALAGVKWTGISTACAIIIQSLRLVILARLLSPEDFGLMAMAMIVIDAAGSYMDLGIGAAIIHHQNATKEQLSSLYWLNIFAGLLIFGLVWLLMPLISMLFREPRVLPLLQVVAVAFPIAAISQQFEILLQKELSFDVLAKQEVIASSSSLAVAALCAASGFGVWALVWGFLTNVTLKTVLLLRIGFRRFQPSLHFKLSDLKGFVAFGLFQMGERAVNFLSERLDQILIGRLLGANILGLYNFAFNLTAQPIMRINPIITRVAFPVFSKIQNDVEKLKNGYLRILSFLATINAPLLLGLAAVAQVAVPLIFGAKWSRGVILIQIMSLVSLLRSTCNPIGSLQLAKGRADLGFKWNLALLILSVPTIYLGAEIGQGTGVAVALLLLQISLVVPVYLFLVRPLIGECAQDYATAILKPVVLAFAMTLVIIPLPRWYAGSAKTVGLIIQVGLGALLYVMLLQLLHREALSEIRSGLF